jgi:C1A family cysteine protease/PKD repeat protein
MEMKKLFAILIVGCLLAVTVPGLITTKKEADKKDINSNEETLITTSTNTGEDTTDFIQFKDKYYYTPAFPDKTQEQLDKMIQDPQPTVSSLDLPSSFSWTSFGGDWSTPAKDQQNCGSCWAFGALGGLESAINIGKADPNFDRDLSEQYVLSCLPASGSCSGGWMSEAIQYIKDTGPDGNNINGCPLESCMPYTATDYVPCDDKCPNWNYVTHPYPAADNILFEVLDYGVTSYTPSNSDDWIALKNWIITYGPIVVDIVATSGWSSYWSSHHSSTDWYQETGSGYTNHAQVCYGWVDTTSVSTGGYWILKNSWGTDFGYQGFNNLAYGSLLLGDRDVTWVTAPEWPEAENPVNPIHPIYFVYAGWNSGPKCPRPGTEIQFTDESRGPVVLWNWDFDGDGVWDVSGSNLNAKNPEWTYTSEGTYQVTEEVWSSDGLSSTLTKPVEVKNIWPPVADPRPSYYGGKDNVVYFDGRFSKDVDGRITAYAWDFNGDGTIDTTEPYYTYTYPNQNGEYEATLKVTDNEGATDTAIIPVKIDKNVPPVTKATVGGVDQDQELWFNDNVKVELKTTDWSGVSRLCYKLDNKDWVESYGLGKLEYSVEFKVTGHGIHTLQYYATDIYGNTESTKTISIGIDANIPSMDYVLDGTKNGEGVYITPVVVTINANDAESGVKAITYKDGGDWILYTSPFTITQGGSHTVDIIVEDKASNTVEGKFTVQLAYAPSAPIISGPSSGKPNIEYTFSFTSYDEENDQVAYYVDWGDGTNTGWSSYVNSGTTVKFKHTWTEQKVITLKAKAKDSKGAESDWGTHKVSMPKSTNRPLFLQFLQNFFEKYPNAFLILQAILQQSRI